MHAAAELMIDPWSFGGDNFLYFLLHRSSYLGDSKPLSFSYREQDILVKSKILRVARLGHR